MKEIKSYRFRKCSDIAMEYPYFEILDQDENVVMDISKSDHGEFRILFYKDMSEKTMSMTMLEKIMSEVKKQYD